MVIAVAGYLARRIDRLEERSAERHEALLAGLNTHGERRVPGRLAGRVTMAEDFDDTPEEIIDAFEGRSCAGTAPES